MIENRDGMGVLEGAVRKCVGDAMSVYGAM
jgi:hypothetical protein